MRRLEQELGVKLFDRSQRSVELTVAGAGLLEEARHVLRHAEVAKQAARNAGDPATTRLRIGYVPDSLPAGVPRALRRLAGSAPRVHLDLTTGPSLRLPSGSDPHEAVLRDAHSRAAPGARAAAVAVEAIVSIAAESAGRRRRHPRGDRRLSRLASRVAQRRDRPRVGLVRPRESGPPEPHLGAVGTARLPRASEAPCMPVGVNKHVSGDATMTMLGA